MLEIARKTSSVADGKVSLAFHIPLPPISQTKQNTNHNISVTSILPCLLKSILTNMFPGNSYDEVNCHCKAGNVFSELFEICTNADICFAKVTQVNLNHHLHVLNFCTRRGDLSNILRNQSRIFWLGEQWPITFATMASTAGANLFFAGANLYVDQTALQKRKISWLCLKCRIMVIFFRVIKSFKDFMSGGTSAFQICPAFLQSQGISYPPVI